MVPPSFTPNTNAPAQIPPRVNDDSERACLLILGDLENSLRSSQAALLAHDVTRLEQLTCEQVELQRALSAHLLVWRGEAVRAAQARVSQLGRVQAVLLHRAQQSLRALSHLAAALQADYSSVAHGRRGMMQGQPAPSAKE